MVTSRPYPTPLFGPKRIKAPYGLFVGPNGKRCPSLMLFESEVG